MPRSQPSPSGSRTPEGRLDKQVSPWVVFVIVAAGQLMVIVDLTVVFTALPSIQADLGLSDIERQWVVNAYVLMFAGCLLLGGRLADLLGRRRMFVIGVLLFTAASATNALAESPGFLVASRAVQGLGAALLAPSALSIVTATFEPGPQRATALAAWGGVAATGGGLGVFVGGALTEFLSWEWVFLINLPLGAMTIAATLLAISRDVPVRGEHRSFDLAGAATVTTGLGLLALAIVSVETSGWLGTQTLMAAAGSAAFLAAFAAIEQRQPAPLVPLARLRNRTLIVSNVGALVIYGGTAGFLFLMSLYLQQVFGWNALEAGSAFIPFFCVVIASAVASERLAHRIGLRLPVAVGLTTAACGLLLLTGLDADSSYVGELLPGFLVFGIGGGLCFGPLTLIANNSLRDDVAGLSSGVYNTSTQVGSVLMIAVLTTIVESVGTGDPATALTDGIAAGFVVEALVLVATGAVCLWAFRRRELEHMLTGAKAAPVLV